MPKYIDVILNWFNMETPRRVLVAWKRLKQDSVFHNTWWAKRMSDFSIMYAMLCTQTRYVLCSKCYEHIPEWSYDDHWTIVRISLSTLEELRICVVCGGDKRFIVMCYIDTSFVTDTNNFISISLCGGAMGWKKVPCGIWMSSKVEHCDGYYNEGWVYDCYSSRKGGHLSQRVHYWTWCSSEKTSTMKLHCTTMVAT